MGQTMVEKLTESLTNVCAELWKKVKELITALREEKANKNGYYETLGAGVASNLRGQNIIEQRISYRPSGGNLDVATGAAFIDSIKGKTVKFNQYIDNRRAWGNYSGSFIVNTYDSRTHTQTFRKGSPTCNIATYYGFNSDTWVNGRKTHVIVSRFLAKRDGSVLKVGLGYSGKDVIYPIFKQFTYRTVVPANTGSTFLGIVDNRNDYNNIYIKDFCTFDLTEIFGAGNEPATVEEFNQWLEDNFGDTDYFAQDNGSLIPVKINSLKTIGFNQYNPSNPVIRRIKNQQYQITGTYTDIWGSVSDDTCVFESYSYGNQVIGGNCFLVNNRRYLSSYDVLPYDSTLTYFVDGYCIYNNQVYKCTTEISTAEEWNADHWTLVPDFASMVSEGIFTMVSITPDANGIFTPTEKYIHVEGGNGTDTCVHLVHSGIRNGEYEPYKENTKSLPITTMQGRLNGTGELVTIFPDGLKSAGTVYDEIKVEDGVTKAIKRIGSVDLGTLTYTVDNGRFYSPISDIKSTSTTREGNGLCSKYEYRLDASSSVNGFFFNTGRIYIYDSQYSDAATFKTAMSGVMLYYELATPEEYVMDDLELPLGYKVDDYGTEEALPSNEGTVASVAPILDIRYGVNALDTIRRLPQTHVTEGSMENFLAALSLVTGDAWTKTWNSTTNKYDFTLTPSATGVLAIIAEALAQQQSEIDGLRENLKHLGEVKATTIDSENMPMVCGQPLVVVGSTAPTVVPMFKGQFYLNTTTPALYVAKAVTNSVNDWAQV